MGVHHSDLQSLGQFSPHGLREEGGCEGAGEADQEEDEVGQPQVGGTQRHGVRTFDSSENISGVKIFQ